MADNETKKKKNNAVIIYSKLIKIESKFKEGEICKKDENFTFSDLVSWVYRMCPNNNFIEVKGEEISAVYDDRIEIYSLRQNK